MLKEPLTAEQAELLTITAAHAARKAVRNYRDGALIAFFILLLGVGFAIWDTNNQASIRRAQGLAARHAIIESGRAVAVDGCNRDFRTIRVLRAQIVKGKVTIQQYVDDGTITQRQANRQIDAIDELLSKYKEPDCQRAEKLLTDDPAAKIPTVKPLHVKGTDG